MGFILSGIYFGWGSLKTGFSFGEIRVRRDSFLGDKRRRVLEWRDSFLQSKVSTFIPARKEAVEKYGAQATIKDLQEVRDSIAKLVLEHGKCCSWPVHEAAKIGAVKLMEIILNTSYDLNTRDDKGRTALHSAYDNGRTEIGKQICSRLRIVKMA